MPHVVFNKISSRKLVCENDSCLDDGCIWVPDPEPEPVEEDPTAGIL